MSPATTSMTALAGEDVEQVVGERLNVDLLRKDLLREYHRFHHLPFQFLPRERGDRNAWYSIG